MKREPTKLRNLVKKKIIAHWMPNTLDESWTTHHHKISEFWEQRDPMSFQRGKKKNKRKAYIQSPEIRMALNFSASTLDARMLHEHDFQPRVKRGSRMETLSDIEDLKTSTAYELLVFYQCSWSCDPKKREYKPIKGRSWHLGNRRSKSKEKK